MYYRRKLLLAILQKGNNSLGKINLQKLLFLITREQENPCFDFLPYKYGCYSFQANKDLEILSRHYLLIDNEEKDWFLKTNTEDYFCQLKEEDQKIITSIFEKITVKDTSKLMKFVYDTDPYFTIYSELTLDEKQQKNREKQKEQIENREKLVVSMGYEGVSIDYYLNALVKNNIKLLCDVRKNAFSRKYGFSKSQLNKYCKSIGIQYVHLPDFGIDSSRRKHLKPKDDYDDLFKQYRIELKTKHTSLKELKKLLDTYKRIAVTCFEKDHTLCHRSILVDYYIQTIENISITHL